MFTVTRIILSIWLTLLLPAAATQRHNTQEPHLSARTDPQYSFRIISTRLRGSEGIFRSCVIVYPDGRFRLERSKQDISGAHAADAQVSLGTLSDAEMEEAFDIRSNEALAAHRNTSRPNGPTSFPPPRLINAEIPRDAYQTQSVIAEFDDTQAPPADVKPLVDFLDGLAARDPAISRGIPGNNCSRPRARAVAK